jgi:sugar lactone lactonase YvrE
MGQQCGIVSLSHEIRAVTARWRTTMRPSLLRTNLSSITTKTDAFAPALLDVFACLCNRAAACGLLVAVVVLTFGVGYGQAQTPAVSLVPVITTVAGNGTQGYNGDNIAATSAELAWPFGVAVDGAGNLYIADYLNARIRKLTPGGIITTVAGTGTAGYNGDNIPATSAELSYPTGVAVDGVGNLYIGDHGNQRIRKVTPDGTITTVAGNGTWGYNGDNIPATSAELLAPWGVVVDGAGNLYIADDGNNRIRKVTPGGTITTVAGTGIPGYNGDNIAATSAQLYQTTGVAVDGAGNLYIADDYNNRIRKVSGGTAPVGFPQAAVGSASASQNVLLAINSSLTISSTTVPQSQGGVQEFAVGTITGCVTDGVTTNAAGSICTVPVTFQPGYPGLRQMPLVVQTSAGLFQFALQGTGTGPMVAFGPGIITTVAGNGNPGYNGDNIPATSAELSSPYSIAVDGAGNLYIADGGNARVHKVTPGGTITTVAGNGTPGYNGDNIPATSAELYDPAGVAVDGAGSLYIADLGNNRIRKVTPDGTITTVAGNGYESQSGFGGYNGDNIPATSAELFWPEGVAVDGAGNLYIADTTNSRIRKVTPGGIITTVAGNGTPGYNGDNIPATSAELSSPYSIAVDGAGNLYIADSLNVRIRKVTPGGTITTVAGNGTVGYNGDNIAATSAELQFPWGVAVDGVGNLYIGDSPARIRKVTLDGTITTVAGNGTQGYNGDNIAATTAELYYPASVALDGAGSLYIADGNNNRIRKVDVSDPPSLTFASTNVGAASAAQDVNVLNLGNAPLTISQISTTSGFTLQGPDTSCSSTGQTLNPAASCVLGIEFNPTASGSISGSVVLTDNTLNVSNAKQTIGLSGTGLSVPIITWVTPAAITYGAALSATQLNATANVPGTFTYTPAAGTVLAAGTQTLSVTFTPTDATDYATATKTVSLKVNQATPVIAWTPASIELGYPLGAAQLDATASISGTFAYTPPSGTVITTSTQTLSVLFTPTDTTDYTSTKMSVSLTVTPGPLASVSPSSIDFGMVYLGTINLKNVTVTNQGTAPMTITDPLLSIVHGGDSNEFVAVNLCPKPLAAGKSCTIYVGFVAGPHYTPQTATLSIMDNAYGSPQTVALSATVINPQAQLSAGSLSFGTQKVGTTSAAQTVKLTNPGTTSLILNSLSINGSFAFAAGNTCTNGGTVVAGASCVISVNFTPTAKGKELGGVTIKDNALSSPQIIVLSGTGN